MRLRPLRRKLISKWAVLGLLMLLLGAAGTIKLTNRVIQKAFRGQRLTPAESVLAYVALELRLNPVPSLRQLWQDSGPSVPAQYAMPRDSIELIGERPLPFDKTLVYSYFDHKADSIVIESRQLRTNRLQQRWRVDYATWSQRRRSWLQAFPLLYRYQYRAELLRQGAYHPLPLGAGRVAFLTGRFSPLYCVDSTGQLLWQNRHGAHHAIEQAPDGTIWTCSFDTAASEKSFLNSALLQVDAQTGETLLLRSLRAIFRANPRHDLSWLNAGEAGQYHLNDVQPVPGDSPYWQRGDLFLSLRNINAVLLYRPRTNRILWRSLVMGTRQHDVNVVNDSVISIFDNNFAPRARGKAGFVGDTARSNFITYNFASGTYAQRFAGLFSRYDISSATRGRARFFARDSVLFAESTDDGYILLSGRRTGQSVRLGHPSFMDGKLAPIGWVRVMNP